VTVFPCFQNILSGADGSGLYNNQKDKNKEKLSISRFHKNGLRQKK